MSSKGHFADVHDIKVLIKRYSEGSRLPYRPMSLKILGAISPIKPRTKDSSEVTPVSEDKEDDGNKFVSPHRKGARENYIPKETIFKNITAILNGFESETKSYERRQ